MNKLIIAVLLIVPFFIPLTASSDLMLDKQDGHMWKALTKEHFDTIFLIAYMNGYAHANSLTISSGSKTPDEFKIAGKNIRYADIRKGINTIYDDNRNLNIYFNDVFSLVTHKLNGASEDFLRGILIRLREDTKNINKENSL